MRITSVELENIKSYQKVCVTLGPGTTAIRGKNGAGKSTLVEAIGFALFDALTYTQAQFVREGERVGTVSVTFISAVDDREYQVVRRCGGTSEWYVYDPALNDRVVEQRADVTDFLRRHLRIESTLSLSTLFNDAVGVPQGTFTADFLQSPANRKKKFDVLLQVEDYRAAAEKLLNAREYLKEQQLRQDGEITRLELETAQLDSWRAQFEDGRARERTITREMAELQRESEALEAERKTLVEQQQQVMQLENAAQITLAEHHAAEAGRQQTQSQLDEAAEATRICAESRPDHTEYLATEQRLAQERAREQQRSQLREQRSDVARRHEGARRDLDHAQAQLAEADQAARDVARLEPEAARQEALEGERTEARHRVSRSDDLAKARQRIARDFEAERQACAQDEQEIARLRQLLPEAEKLDERRRLLEQAQAAHATFETNRARLQAVRDELSARQEQRDEEAQAEAKAAANLRKILAQQAVVEELPALEAEQKSNDDLTRQIETRIEHHRLSRQQSGIGNCPFLREPCLNIQKRGENSLISYFDRMIADDERELAPLRQRADELAVQVEHGHKVLRYWDRRGEYEDQQTQAAKKRQRHEAECQRLIAEQRQLEQTLAQRADPDALDRLRADCERSQKATMQCARLPDLEQHLRQASGRRDAQSAEMEQMAGELAALESAAADLRRIEEQLAALGDPRSQIASLRQRVADRPARADRVKSAQQEARRLGAELAACEKHLAPFATLDDELAGLEAARARASVGHMRYLRHEQTASLHGERKKAHAAAEQRAHTAATRHTKAARDAERARATFDSARLDAVVARGDALSNALGQQTEALRSTQELGARLAREIARVEALLTDLSAAREERQTWDELGRMLQQFRDTIKEAGPNILRTQLRTISHEANRIFGEILGDRSAELTWEADYEVILRRDGRERTFAQLSGGEQMSAALAVRLALLRRLSRLDVAFFDEPTQNMDGERRGNLADQIRRVRGFDQLLVISHDDTFEQGLDGVIVLEKRNGKTVLTEDETLIPA